MQRKSTQYVIDRFKEKFYGTISFKDKEPFELTKDDYAYRKTEKKNK